MKNYLKNTFLVTSFLFCSIAWGQMVEPTYKIGYSVTEAQVGDTIEIILQITPPKGWHVYSTKNEGCEISPILATLDIEKDASFMLLGGLQAIDDVAKRDEMFECKVWYFNGIAVFKQKIVVLTKDLNVIAEFSGQMCDDKSCIPLYPDAFTIQGIKR